jgi:ADP-ribose pyrophosphatase YjhB (NUDIX family)
MTIKVVDIIVERKGMILLTKRGDYWILPGGEIEPGEDEVQCLEEVVSREMKDQVSSIFKKLEKTIKGPSPVRDGDVDVSVYVGDISSKKMSDVKDCNAHWFSRESVRAIRLSNITKDVLELYFSEYIERKVTLCEHFDGCDFFAANSFRLSKRQYDLMVDTFCNGKLLSYCRRIKWRREHDSAKPPKELCPNGYSAATLKKIYE